MNRYKKLFGKLIFTSVLTLAFMGFQPDWTYDQELGTCSWYENGCEYMVTHYSDGTGDGYINCGGGADYYGTGTFGTCSGLYESN